MRRQGGANVVEINNGSLKIEYQITKKSIWQVFCNRVVARLMPTLQLYRPALEQCNCECFGLCACDRTTLCRLQTLYRGLQSGIERKVLRVQKNFTEVNHT